jgi:cation transport regulator ChaC
VSDISLTESAAKRVAWIAERQSRPAILRLAVDGGGCAGFTYKFELADAAHEIDRLRDRDAEARGHAVDGRGRHRRTERPALIAGTLPRGAALPISLS